MKRRLAAILAADVVGFSRLMEDDEEATLATLNAYREIIDGLVADHSGWVFGSAGDSVIAEFASPVEAVRCALEMQQEVESRNAAMAEDRRMRFRIGVNLGDVVAEKENLHGDGVNIAVRLEELAEPAGVFLSGTVYDHLAGKLDFVLDDLGEQKLKNIARPVRVWRWAGEGTAQWRDTSQPRPDKPSIAVLPFVNMSGDSEQDYFSDGITEDIITDLSKISSLFVVARNSTFTYKDTPVKVQQVSKDLDVRYVVEGSVRKAGNRVRISAQLIDGATSGHLWAERYDRDLTDIFAVQDEIAHSIAEALKVKLLPNESKAIKKIPTEDIEAYQFYLRGRQFFNRHTKTSYDFARKMFSKAIERDPNYARAYAGIADCNSWLYEFYKASVPLEDVLATSAKALDLDDELAEAHASHGFALAISEQFERAEREFEKAIRLDPNLFEAYFFHGRTCFNQGKFEQAAGLFELASEVQPDDFQALMLLANAYRTLAWQEDAEDAERRCFEKAERELQLRPENARAAYAAALTLASRGDTERAKEWASRALSSEPDDHLTQYNVACVYSLLGELDQAIDLLERSTLSQGRAWKDWLKHDSDLDPLRDHPRFRTWLRYLDEQDG